MWWGHQDCLRSNPVDIYELGLIYDVKVSEEAGIAMTLSPSCPVAVHTPWMEENSAAGINSTKSRS